VDFIGSDAFQNCSGLRSITNLNPVPQDIGAVATHRFSGPRVFISNIDLYVPTEALDAYNNAAVWKDFKSINGGAVSSISYYSAARANSSLPQISVRGKTLTVSNLGTSSAPVTLRLIDLRGKTVSSFNTANGNVGTFSLARVPASRYLVEVRRGGARVGTVGVLVR
jgi:hypothetical protein